jgi:hypothetical protein
MQLYNVDNKKGVVKRRRIIVNTYRDNYLTLLIDWCSTPTLAVFQLYRGVLTLLNTPRARELTAVFNEVRVAQSLAFCVVLCKFFSLFVIFCHRFTASDYPFGIFKLFHPLANIEVI